MHYSDSEITLSGHRRVRAKHMALTSIMLQAAFSVIKAHSLPDREKMPLSQWAVILSKMSHTMHQLFSVNTYRRYLLGRRDLLLGRGSTCTATCENDSSKS